jgi:hypothetical protein
MTDGTSAKIVRFPVNRAGSGSVYCAPLKLHFPPLFRVVQTFSPAELRLHGAAGAEMSERFVHYTLSEEDNYVGTIVRQPVNRIMEADQNSIVIRHHANVEQAMSYINGVADSSDDQTVEPICQTKEGVFTAVRRPTKPGWPGPMVIYAAIHGSDNIAGYNVWQLARDFTGDAISRSTQRIVDVNIPLDHATR